MILEKILKFTEINISTFLSYVNPPILKFLVNCELSFWGDWSLCSATCGGGLKKSNRTINQSALNGGSSCAEELNRTMECNIEPCPGKMISNNTRYVVVFVV